MTETGETGETGAPEVTGVTVARERGLTVEWSDGVIATFDLEELRAGCPCAACRGLRDQGQLAWPRPGGPAELAIVDAELVGAWGLSVRWNDGHDTGIYPWDRLRAWHLAPPG